MTSTVSDSGAGTAEFDPFAGPAIVATAPTTEPQRELWTASSLGDDASLAFNESVSLRFRGALDLGALRAAFTDLVARHEALRATVSADGLTLFVSAPFEPVIGWHELGSQTEEERERAVAALLKSEVETPFDLTRGPLFRLHLVELGPADHLAVFTAHHIVNDGWSTAVLVKDWAKLYNLRRAGKPVDLPLPESFSAYATAQAARPEDERAPDEAYWLKQFGGQVPILDLPSDRPRPPQKTYRSEREDVVLERELVAEVRRAGAKSRASLFATLLAGFKALVYRLSGQGDLVIGIPAAGQSVGGHDTLVGHCVNMLPLRSAIDRQKPFTELLTHVRSLLLDAQEHQDFTLGKLLTKLPIARDPSRLPLISVIFNVDRGLAGDAIGFEDVQVDLKANARSYENFDLFLNAVELDGRVELECQYNSDLFDRATVRRWLESYRTLLSDVARDTAAPIGRLAVVSQAERELLARWNATNVDFRRDACVHTLVEEQVRRTPDAIACEFQGRTLTYAELDARANRLARELRKLGARRGELVGLCVERSLDLLVGLLGIAKAGAGYVPLDPGYPTERLALMVGDAGMRVLVTESKLEQELALGVERVYRIDELERSSESADPLERDDASAVPESVAYVIYTSGSTGKPKGVLVPHRSVVNLLQSVAKRPGLSANDVMLAITTMSFDIAVSETWLPLSVGAKISLVTREVAADGALLRDVIERTGVTFIDATPATYRLLLGAGWQGGDGLTLICTGEAMPKDLAAELPKRARAVWNGYGPTETTVWSTFWQVPSGAERVLIGKPVDNTQILLLDEDRQPVPIGSTGELYIAGAGVTHGYHGRPDLTAERFVPNPLDPEAGTVYRTGDLGRYLPSGDLECLGRNDHQVKLRGFRIELGEIEHALVQHPGVREAAVMLREDRPGDAALVGYLVYAGAPVSASDLRVHLKRTLPEYMVPAAYVTLERMPLTPSGKVDRRALPAPSNLERAPQGEFVAPRTDTERLLAELWASTLGVARVSVDDDFFALGGHSLLASQILGRLRRNHGIELSFRKFFEAPTIARLAALIDGNAAASAAANAEAARRIERRPPGSPTPLSLSQERLFLLEEMHPAQRVVHNLPAAWYLHGRVELALLQRSLDAIAARQEMLRTCVSFEGGTALQRVEPSVSLLIEEIDLRHLPEAEREPEMMRRIRAATAEPFDLARAPLFRSALFRLEDERSLYYTLRHNLIWDGWSFDVFLSELCAAYAAFERGETPALPELRVAYGDFAVWQRQWQKSAFLGNQIEWWQNTLAGVLPDLELPLDRPRPSQPTYAGGNVSIKFTAAEGEALAALARASGTTLFTLLFAGFTVLLHRYSGQEEVLVGTPVRGRPLPELEDLIGPFINTVVLRTRPQARLTFREYLDRVRDVTLDAFSNEDMPLEMLGTRPPPLRAFFSFQDARTRPLSLGSVGVRQVDVEPPAAANDLMLWIMERPNELIAVANFSTDVFERETIELLLRSFQTLLRDVIANPTTTLDGLRVLSDEDAASASAERQPAAAAEKLAHELIVESAERTPGAAACVDAERTLAFETLVRQARIVAETLSARGVRPGSAVAVLATPSPDFVLSCLAVWQAGGAVLPLDPEAPRSYHERSCARANAALVLTSNALREKAPDRATCTIEELAIGSGERGAIQPDQPAWLDARLEANGEVALRAFSHRELVSAALALAGELGITAGEGFATASPVASLATPLCLLASASAGASLAFVDVDAGVSEPAKRAKHFFGPLVTSLELLPRDYSKGLRSIVLDGPATERGLDVLLAFGARTFTLEVLAAERLVPFLAELRAPSAWQTLGRPLGAGRARVSHRNGVAPPGAPGVLSLASGDGPFAEVPLRARRRRDGVFEVSSRAGEAVMINGLVVEPAVVARALEEQPGVGRACVRAEQSNAGARVLVAYVSPRPGASFTQTELRRHLRQSLPEPMVPGHFVELDSLPLDANGAVQRDALPSPFARVHRLEHVDPRTPEEKLLAAAWCEALRLPAVSVYDNFFDLGGHSLLCFQVLARVERETGKRLSPRLFLLNTLEQVAKALDGAAPARSPSPADESTDKKSGLAGRVLRGLEGLWQRR